MEKNPGPAKNDAAVVPDVVPSMEGTPRLNEPFLRSILPGNEDGSATFPRSTLPKGEPAPFLRSILPAGEPARLEAHAIVTDPPRRDLGFIYGWGALARAPANSRLDI